MSPVPFVELDAVANAAFHTKHLRQDWYSLSYLWWNRKVDYAQKWQLADEVPFQFHIPELEAGDTITVQVIDCDAVVKATISVDATLPASGGNVYLGVDLETYQYRFTYGDIPLTAGRYFILITIDRDGDVKRWISEPQDVKADWPGTILQKYAHPENDYDVFFSLNPNFQIRYEGEITNYRFTFKDSRFVDQINKPSLTRSDRTRECDLVVGAKSYRKSQFGVPKWLTDIIGEALRCAFNTFDNKSLVRADNATLELEPNGNSDLSRGTVTMEETDPAGTTTYGAGQLSIVEIPTSFPYALSPLTISNGVTTIALNAVNGTEIVDGPAQTAFVTALNALSVGGTFSVENDILVYVNGPGESFSAATGASFPRYMDFELNGNGDFQYFYWKSAHVNKWDSTLDYVAAAPGMSDVGHSYVLTPGTIQWRMYHDDTLTRMEFPVPVDTPQLTELPAALPSTITSFEVQSQAIPTIDIAMMYPAAAVLSKFIVRNSGVSSIGVSAPFDTTPNGQFANLNTFDMGYNELAAISVDRIFNGLYNHANYSGGGTVDLQFQSPAAAPTGVSLTARTNLTFAGWSLFHD